MQASSPIHSILVCCVLWAGDQSDGRDPDFHRCTGSKVSRVVPTVVLQAPIKECMCVGTLSGQVGKSLGR